MRLAVYEKTALAQKSMMSNTQISRITILSIIKLILETIVFKINKSCYSFDENKIKNCCSFDENGKNCCSFDENEQKL
uniref:Uncharacterized protein n=1 Tax=Glossina morsitans morsitans TaxID=37546 RepID=A0ABK9NAT9_GLOMM